MFPFFTHYLVVTTQVEPERDLISISMLAWISAFNTIYWNVAISLVGIVVSVCASETFGHGSNLKSDSHYEKQEHKSQKHHVNYIKTIL